jgi:hypothetical protein
MPASSKVVRSTAKKSRPPNAGKGRRKGVPNKTTALLKEAVLLAATEAGGKDGLVGYLKWLAKAEPKAFAPLLGKIIPMQVTGEDDGPVKIIIGGSDAGL